MEGDRATFVTGWDPRQPGSAELTEEDSCLCPPKPHLLFFFFPLVLSISKAQVDSWAFFQPKISIGLFVWPSRGCPERRAPRQAPRARRGRCAARDGAPVADPLPAEPEGRPGGIAFLASPAPEYAAALMGKGYEQKKADIKFGVSYLHPAVGKEEGARLSLFAQVRTRLNIFPAS